MTGKGSATATLEGDTFPFPDPSQGCRSSDEGILSLSMGRESRNPLVDLIVSADVAGKVTGQTKLGPASWLRWRSGKLYIHIDSEKVPSGHLWGWLLDEHEIVGQDVPQKGPWVRPAVAVKTK